MSQAHLQICFFTVTVSDSVFTFSANSLNNTRHCPHPSSLPPQQHCFSFNRGLRPLPASPSEAANGLFCVKPGFISAHWQVTDPRGIIFFFWLVVVLGVGWTVLYSSALPYSCLPWSNDLMYLQWVLAHVCHCFQIMGRERRTTFMTLQGLSGTWWSSRLPLFTFSFASCQGLASLGGQLVACCTWSRGPWREEGHWGSLFLVHKSHGRWPHIRKGQI